MPAGVSSLKTNKQTSPKLSNCISALLYLVISALLHNYKLPFFYLPPLKFLQPVLTQVPFLQTYSLALEI